MSISALPWKVGAIESGQVAIDSADDKEVTGFIEEDDALHILNLAKDNTQLRAENAILKRDSAAAWDKCEERRLENASLKAELAEAKKRGELVDACYMFINSPVTVESCRRFNDAVEAMKGK